MRFLLPVLIIALLAGLLSLFMPWYIIAIVSGIVVFVFELRPGKAFLAPFTAIFLLWIVTYFIKESGSGHVLSGRMAQLFFVNNPYLLMLIGALVGGLVAGLGGLSASLLRLAVPHKEGTPKHP